MSVNFMMFLVVSVVLIPIAYVVGIVDKVKHLRYLNKDDQRMNYGFFVLGFIYLLLDLFADVYYFWHNNFRTGLKKIIIEVEDSAREITLDEAKKNNPKNTELKIGEKIFEELPQIDFGTPPIVDWLDDDDPFDDAPF